MPGNRKWKIPPPPPVRFRQERLEGGWTLIHVLQGEALRGRITLDAKSGKYRYFEGAHNNVVFLLENRDLTALQAEIAESLRTTAAPFNP
jgi:hypothetical protein